MKNANWKMLGALVATLVMSSGSLYAADEAKPLFENNFEQVEAGPLPDTFMVLDGGFEVKAEGGNKFIELPGAPLESFGILFGPTEKENVAVSARIDGTNKGRRYPTFAVGLNGQGGYKMQVSPAKKAIELYKGDEVVTSVPFEWKSGEWTMMRLQIRKTGDGAWKVEGKAWPQGGTEPKDWLINFDEKKEPTAGRASIWGQPYATTPIQFDDLKVTRVTTDK